jgi:adenine deaminase
MYNCFETKTLAEAGRRLTAVALGQEKAQLVIRGAKLVNVCTCEIQDNMDVAVAYGRIALVGDASHCIGDKTTVVDAAGRYLAPGFLDGHIHVESSMLGVGEYARAVVPRGTTGIYMDPHEICNVLGLDGVRHMIEDAARTPLKTMVTTPSCVPAVPGFEDTGAKILASDVEETMSWEAVVGLGEMMNFPGILSGEANAHDEVAATLTADKVVTGHYSIPDTGAGLNAYIASGVSCCHESTRAEDALEKIRRGMYAMIREGSAWHDLAEVSRAVTDNDIDTRFVCLVSDDTHPHTLIEDGHLDHILRRAVAEGIEPLKALQMVTINTATCFRMQHELGSVTPGKCADLVLFDDLTDFRVSDVFIDGHHVASEDRLLTDMKPYQYPGSALNSVHLDKLQDTKHLAIPAAKPDAETARVRVIEIVPARVGTVERFVDLPVQDGLIEADPDQDVLKAVVFERHKRTGRTGLGFVKGFGIQDGAMASTVAHDAHNLLVIGSNDQDMILAANTLIESGGGMCVVSGGKVLGHVALPIAGLMSKDSAEQVAAKVAAMDDAWRKLGSTIASPFMTMALIPLACLPELRLTNRGLVDCRTFEFVELEAE